MTPNFLGTKVDLYAGFLVDTGTAMKAEEKRAVQFRGIVVTNSNILPGFPFFSIDIFSFGLINSKYLTVSESSEFASRLASRKLSMQCQLSKALT